MSFYDIGYFVAYSNKKETTMHLYVHKYWLITWPPHLCLEYVHLFPN